MTKPTYEELLKAAQDLLLRLELCGLDTHAHCQCGKPRKDFVCLMCHAKDVIKKAEAS